MSSENYTYVEIQAGNSQENAGATGGGYNDKV